MNKDSDVIDDKTITNHRKGVAKVFYTFKNMRKILHHEKRKVIIFDESLIFLISLFFTKKSYLWLWNTVEDDFSTQIRLWIAKKTKRVYTFDKGDCEKYGFEYNSQFFDDDIIESNCVEEYDLYFVGLDKGRYSTVKEIYDFSIKRNLLPKFNMVKEAGKIYDVHDFLVNDLVKYNDVLDGISRSKAILDICKKGQVGMTYRAMEAIFYDKKIVTNNVNYKKLPFYSSDKIYIIENNKFEGMEDFIKSSSISYSEDVKKYYRIGSWLHRFG